MPKPRKTKPEALKHGKTAKTPLASAIVPAPPLAEPLALRTIHARRPAPKTPVGKPEK
jgi:hypothetical protein